MRPAIPVSIQISKLPKVTQPQSPQEPLGVLIRSPYRLGPKGLRDDERGWTNTCITQSPQYQAEFLTDQSADDLVKDRFAGRSDIVDTCIVPTVPILMANLLRYLLLYAEGGVWLDPDVS